MWTASVRWECSTRTSIASDLDERKGHKTMKRDSDSGCRSLHSACRQARRRAAPAHMLAQGGSPLRAHTATISCDDAITEAPTGPATVSVATRPLAGCWSSGRVTMPAARCTCSPPTGPCADRRALRLQRQHEPPRGRRATPSSGRRCSPTVAPSPVRASIATSSGR